MAADGRVHGRAAHPRPRRRRAARELLRPAVVGRHAPVAAAMLRGTAGRARGRRGAWSRSAVGGRAGAGGLLFGRLGRGARAWCSAPIALCWRRCSPTPGRRSGRLAGASRGRVRLRAAGDVQENGLVWLSPIGWSQATHPLGRGAVVAAAACRWSPPWLLVAAAVALAEHRDVGAGLRRPRAAARPRASRLAGRPGRARAAAPARRRSLGWAAGVFVLAARSGR